MPRTILVLLSEYGYWGEELVGPLFHFDKAGYGVVFATPNGNRAHVLPPSIDPAYVDPPLGRTVTSHEVADLARILDESDRLDNPLSLAGWIPSARTPARRTTCASSRTTTAGSPHSTTTSATTTGS